MDNVFNLVHVNSHVYNTVGNFYEHSASHAIDKELMVSRQCSEFTLCLIFLAAKYVSTYVVHTTMQADLHVGSLTRGL